MTETAKIQIVAKFLSSNVESKAEFARDNSISPRTLARYIAKYRSDAEEQLKTNKGSTKVADSETKQQAKPTGTTPAAETTGRRKKKGDVRNGRWAVLNAVFDKHGVEEKASYLMEKANEASTEAGLKPLAKGSFYAMLSIARKDRGVDIRRLKAENDQETA